MKWTNPQITVANLSHFSQELTNTDKKSERIKMRGRKIQNSRL